MMNILCNVCTQPLSKPVYESAENVSITTMNKFISGKTQVYFCQHCGHLQTSELPNLAEFYAHEYEINLTSEDEDQLYKIVDGKKIFRAEHQANVLMQKLVLKPGIRVLDYGCAKAPTLQKVLKNAPDIEPFLFDVTDKYIPFWEKFSKPQNWSVHQLNPDWHHQMDVVLSFYALEHVADLQHALDQIKLLLKPGGVFYFIVPNVYANIADFIVADHINHFSASSLKYLLSHKGFGDIHVDDQIHDAAFVVHARLESHQQDSAELTNQTELTIAFQAAKAMADYWQDIVSRIQAFEQAAEGPVAIYGAGFYGNLIASSLNQLDKVKGFVDQNPFLQGSALHGRPVFAPDQLPNDVQSVMVGMNPKSARANIESIAAWKNRTLEFFYL